MKAITKTLIGATATPLASIFGSGFLVIVPILKGAVGPLLANRHDCCMRSGLRGGLCYSL